MDKQTISEYNKGWRAYINYDGKMIFQDTRDGFISGSEDIYVDKWHALRAYQDAERKKGVPIYFEDLPDSVEASREFRSISEQHCVMSGIKDGRHHWWPEIHTYTDDEDGGQFVNFRWRAGYPKGGKNG